MNQHRKRKECFSTASCEFVWEFWTEAKTWVFRCCTTPIIMTSIPLFAMYRVKEEQTILFVKIVNRYFKDVSAHCYCASLVPMLFIGHTRAMSFSSARTESKTQQNIELTTFALTLFVNINFLLDAQWPPLFFRHITSFSHSFHYIKKRKSVHVWEVLIISHILFK